MVSVKLFVLNLVTPFYPGKVVLSTILVLPSVTMVGFSAVGTLCVPTFS